jgi:hypothetical protein
VHLFRAVYWHSGGVVQRSGSWWAVWLVIVAVVAGAASGLVLAGRTHSRGDGWRALSGVAGLAVGGFGILLLTYARGQVTLVAGGHGLSHLLHRVESFFVHKLVRLSPGPGAYLLLAGGLLLIAGALIPPARPSGPEPT